MGCLIDQADGEEVDSSFRKQGKSGFSCARGHFDHRGGGELRVLAI
jgi:hypothetical protein